MGFAAGTIILVRLCKYVGWRYVSTRRRRGVPKMRSFSQASIDQS
jgi:hypothetical protein